MKKWVSAFIVFLSVIALVGCGTDGKSASPKTEDFSGTTIETKFGLVELTEKPERVVALGWGDAETALALGVEPVGASDWLDFGNEGIGPWLEGAYETSPTILGTTELDYEQIAALEPDVILDVKSSGDEERYNRLSEIAPTIGVPEGSENYLTTYEEQVQMISKALGKEEEGEQLLKDIDAAFEKVKEDYPHFAGKTVAIGAYTSEGWAAYVKGDARADFMSKIGFTNKEEIENKESGDFRVKISDEELELLDADLTVVIPIMVDAKEVTNHPLYQKLPSVSEGRSIVLDGDYSDAFSIGTAPALLWALEKLPPMFDQALDGESDKSGSE